LVDFLEFCSDRYRSSFEEHDLRIDYLACPLYLTVRFHNKWKSDVLRKFLPDLSVTDMSEIMNYIDMVSRVVIYPY